MNSRRDRRRAAWPVLVLATLLWASSAQPATAETRTFGFTGAEQIYDVPASVHAIHVVAIGARGGRGTNSIEAIGGAGGFGARLEADLAVTPGQVLFVEVGGVGENGALARAGTGGFNGGGTSFGNVPGGGGGGATDIRTCSVNAIACSGTPNTLGSRLLVAAGGGGGGSLGRRLEGVGGDGGNAGQSGVTGQIVGCEPGITPGGGGGPGTQSAGGAGGAAGNNGAGIGGAGELGEGGEAALGPSSPVTGGGGGGGYFGGGAGGASRGCAGGGGGGGSSFAAAVASGVSLAADSTGQGGVVITTLASPPSKPSNVFKFGKLSRNKRTGTATLTVDLPGPGRLSLAGKGLVRRERAVGGAGSIALPIKAKGAFGRRLARTGHLELMAKVTFAPRGADPNTRTRAVKLVRN
jgi:Glycine rich protein